MCGHGVGYAKPVTAVGSTRVIVCDCIVVGGVQSSPAAVMKPFSSLCCCLALGGQIASAYVPVNVISGGQLPNILQCTCVWLCCAR